MWNMYRSIGKPNSIVIIFILFTLMRFSSHTHTHTHRHTFFLSSPLPFRSASLLKLTEYLTHRHIHTHRTPNQPPNIYYTNTLSDCLNITLSASICSVAVSLFLCRFSLPSLKPGSATIIQCRVRLMRYFSTILVLDISSVMPYVIKHLIM